MEGNAYASRVLCFVERLISTVELCSWNENMCWWYVHVTIQSGFVLVPWHQAWRRQRKQGERQIYTRGNESMFGSNYWSVGLRLQTASEGLIVFFITLSNLLLGQIKCFHSVLCNSFILHFFGRLLLFLSFSCVTQQSKAVWWSSMLFFPAKTGGWRCCKTSRALNLHLNRSTD